MGVKQIGDMVIVDYSCTTHHHACACREEKFRALEQENQKLRELLGKAREALEERTEHPSLCKEIDDSGLLEEK